MGVLDIGSLGVRDTYHTARMEAAEKNVTAGKNAVTSNGNKKNGKLYKACREFEAIYIKQMLDVMRKTVNKTGLLDGGFAQDVFEDMLYDEYAKKMAENAGFGLSDALYKQLSSYVEE
ncbi:MAG: rod-binding protein [Spirochaetales bacterium]|nr:rod-binding protein [Spirochaetales bacterium]